MAKSKRATKRGHAPSAAETSEKLPGNKTPGMILIALDDDGECVPVVVLDTDGNTRRLTPEEQAKYEAECEDSFRKHAAEAQRLLKAPVDDPDYRPPIDDPRYRQYVRWFDGHSPAYRPTYADAWMKKCELERLDKKLVQKHVQDVYGSESPSGEQPRRTEIRYLGDCKITIDGETVEITTAENCVIQALVELQAATKANLEDRSGVTDAVRILRRLLKKYPSLSKVISMPGAKGKGGYRTTLAMQ